MLWQAGGRHRRAARGEKDGGSFMSENNRDYQVGRGKPQVHSRFELAPAADEKVLVNPIARQRKSREQEFRERDILSTTTRVAKGASPHPRTVRAHPFPLREASRPSSLH